MTRSDKKVNALRVRVGDRDMAMLDHLCAMAPDKPSRSAMVRRLIARAHAGGLKFLGPDYDGFDVVVKQALSPAEYTYRQLSPREWIQEALADKEREKP